MILAIRAFQILLILHIGINFLLPDEIWRMVSQILLILQIYPKLFFLSDPEKAWGPTLSLRKSGDPPYPIQSVKSIKTLSPHISFDKKN